MEIQTKARRGHCVVLAYPAQGHINPLLEFSKRLQHEGITVTLVCTRSFCNKLHKLPGSNISFETISDGFDDGGIDEAERQKVNYYDRFREVGTETLIELIEKLNETGKPVDCIVYDSFLTWALDVSRKLGLLGVSFLTQNIGVDSIYYHVNKGKLKFPLAKDKNISLPGLPCFEPWDMPTFLYECEPGTPVIDLVVGQFSNIEEADWILCNSFYELEIEVADCMRKIWPNLITVGPTIPYEFLLNNNINTLKDEVDEDHGFAKFKSEECSKWLDNQQKQLVVYVSLGTMVPLTEEQMEELAWGLTESGMTFLWVVRESEESKLPKNFPRKTQKGLVVSWCHQLKVLSHEAIGCFVTHCGWNSTLEALSLGVPMVLMPLWSDQRTNAKIIKEVWKIGVRVQVDEKGIVRRQALKNSIWEIMKEEGSEVKNNAMKWKNLAAKAVNKGGSSWSNIEEFMDSLSRSKVDWYNNS